ncbi:MAG: hypothetical protein R3B57_08360 [Phycisphaerales bacterium]
MGDAPNHPGGGGGSDRGAVLFTAFEPSGDDHAAAVIAELKARDPDLTIYAWGGPKMEAAGAKIVHRTGQDAVMGMPGLAKIREHRRINAHIKRWLVDHPVRVHVPVDSPAANFPVCAITKPTGARVVHLVAPQLWAWGAWRLKKLKRLTDHVLCLLPFEEEWFRSRGVDATFIGHPIFDRVLDEARVDARIADWPGGDPRVALMPGSRPAEITKNFPLLVGAYRRLEREHEGIAGVVAATRPEIEPELRRLAGDWPRSLRVEHSRTEEVARWCDLALVVSGTVTLQIAKQAKPMVIVYKSGRLGYSLIGRWFLKTKFFSLPNVVAGKQIVPELIPHFGGSEPIADLAVALLEDPAHAEEQRRELRRVASMFDGRCAATAAADIIELFLEPQPDAEPIAEPARATA